MKNLPRTTRKTRTLTSISNSKFVRFVSFVVKNFLLFSLFSLLLFSCSDSPVSKGDTSKVIISFTDVSRTVMPDTPAPAYFTSFDVNFYDNVGSDDQLFPNKSLNLSGQIEIDAIATGNYYLVIIANKDGQPAAVGDYGNVTIGAGLNTISTVLLKMYLDQGEGKFSWNIGITGITATKAVMNIYDLNGDPVHDPVNLPSNNTATGTNNPITLNSGVYSAVIDIEVNDTAGNGTFVRNAVKWYELVHIYSTLTSTFQKTFTIDDFNTPNYIVTFKYNSPTAAIADGKQSVAHNGTIGAMPTYSLSGWRLEGWYTQSNGGGTKYTGTETILDDLTLSANWQRAASFNPPTFDPGDLMPRIRIQGGAELFNKQTVGVLENSTVSFELINTDEYAGTNITWNYNGDNTSGPTFSINTMQTGIKILTVEGLHNNGRRYSTFFEINAVKQGDGTSSNPFLITNTNYNDMFAYMRTPTGLTQHYKLAGDIVFSAANWETIGSGDISNQDNAFRGSFDGGNKTIFGLTINSADVGKLGLFGYAINAEIKNLILKDVNIIGKDTIGGIAGSMEFGGTIANCHVYGTIKGNDVNVGGVAGFIDGVSLLNCSFNGGIESSNNVVGGITGWANGSVNTITNCYSAGTITGLSEVGGIVGRAGNDWGGGSGTVNFCYSTAAVTGTYSVGGIVGNRENAAISNCVALNSSITSTTDSPYIGCVMGGGTGSSNYARANMPVNSAAYNFEEGGNQKDGEVITTINLTVVQTIINAIHAAHGTTPPTIEP